MAAVLELKEKTSVPQETAKRGIFIVFTSKIMKKWLDTAFLTKTKKSNCGVEIKISDLLPPTSRDE